MDDSSSGDENDNIPIGHMSKVTITPTINTNNNNSNNNSNNDNKENNNTSNTNNNNIEDDSDSSSSDSDSDSASENIMSIAQMAQNKSKVRTKNPSFGSPKSKSKSKSKSPTKSKAKSQDNDSDSDSDDSDSDDNAPLLSNPNPINTKSNSNNGQYSKTTGKKRINRRFRDSDSDNDSDDSDDSDEDDSDLPIGAAVVSRPPPPKKRRISSTPSMSASVSTSSDGSPILKRQSKTKRFPNSTNSSSKISRSRNNNNNNDSDDDSSDYDNETNSNSNSHYSTSSRVRNNRNRNSNKSKSNSSRSLSRVSKSTKTKKPAKKTSKSKSPRKKNDGGILGKAGYSTRKVYPASSFAKKSEIIPLETDKNAVKWWDRDIEELLADSNKWHSLDHNGVVFAPPYEAHGIKMKYNGKKITLTPDQEEIATMYAVMIETDWIHKDKFQNNFMKVWKKVLNDKKQPIINSDIIDIKKCDFRSIYDWYQKKKEEEKELKKDKEYKLKLKYEKEQLDNKYGYALVDGILEKVGNYKVEPPGLFRGRGEHPKMGLLKKRLNPEDVILNIGKNTPIPPCPISGHQWGGVIHDQTVTYIAKWIENINGQHKFVYLHSSSRFKGESDLIKYEKARKLKKHVQRIREDYASKLNSKSLMERQLSTAVWIIDHLSIRVGNEKDTDEEADTVGVCSLRLEHIKFTDVPESENNRNGVNDINQNELTVDSLNHNQKTGFFITLDFLGKDSMRYLQTIEIPRVIYLNLKFFCTNKKADVDIFHKIDPNKLNDYLRSQMDGLTAKVFRTHNASVCLQNELKKLYHKQVGKITPKSSIADKVFFYNQCNMMVAILCNHQKTVSKGHAASLEKMELQIKEAKKKIKELESELKVVQGKKSFESLKHKPKKLRSEDQIKKSIKSKKEQLRKKELSKVMKDENKEVALGTSKINYMDPRITVAFCKRLEVPIEKVFNKSLLDKFPWAMNAKLQYEF